MSNFLLSNTLWDCFSLPMACLVSLFLYSANFSCVCVYPLCQHGLRQNTVITMRLAIKMRDMKGIETEVPRGLTNDIFGIESPLLSLSLHDSGTNEGAIKVMREIVTEFDINKPTMSATYLCYFKCQWEI